MRARIVGYLVIVAVLVIGGVAARAYAREADGHPVDPAAKLTQEQAAARLGLGGVSWRSRGHCTAWYGPTCTSLEQINESTVVGLVALRRASKCPVVVTAGTEVGHHDDEDQHRRGRQVSLQRSPCLQLHLRDATVVETRRGSPVAWETERGVSFRLEGRRTYEVRFPVR
ncbi:hypothetical protein [Luteipulveratus flavus]|uniref:Uncharacterized protein n=1 Tax=Luteipulveratus flavus TaxID=3031728 RepID=A0ABT6C9M6_9MICO|nr:hypothetical protein [Luteipulveratus sp. YIM 133296]MDF8265609.1 hypothetical protein [Luteipulveratus sp. YIM 133296]